MTILLLILLSLIFIVISIIKLHLHPFLALFLAALGFGIFSGMPPSLILTSINDGFGGVLGKIGPLILFGVIIGSFLEKSGGALILAKKILNVIGEKSLLLAMMLTGYIVSIPVFADSGFIMMNALNKTLSSKAGVSYAGSTAALAIGLTATHVMVPPTPGPVAAAGILGADLGLVIFWGVIVSLVSLVPSYIFAKTYASKVTISSPAPVILDIKAVKMVPPTAFKSFLPIIIPILLIIFKSVADYPTQPFGTGSFVDFITFIGNPVIALLVGVFISFTLPKKLDKKIISSSGWIGEAVLVAAPIILITGAGGIFGKMLQNSGIGDMISSGMVNTNLGLWLPFLLAAALKTSQGSSTVALISTASILAPLMPSLGLDSEISKALAVLAIGAGSAVTSHANDSFFWVLTQMTGMNIKEGNQIQSLGTIVFGVTGIIVIYLISIILI